MILDGPDFPAPAKLNLFLHVVGRRADGYHLLQTAFTFIDLGERLRISVRRDGMVRRVNPLPGVAEDDDLAVRAARALQEATGCGLGADIEIDKTIPMGGGLGGGSSDAATALVALNRLWSTGLGRAELQKLGLTLGADVPVFVFGQSAFAEGVGEALQAVDLPELWYLLVTPAVQVPTAAVFADPELTRDSIPLKMADFSAAAFLPLLARLRNDLEPVVRGSFPEVAAALDALNSVSGESVFAPGGANARMTGSGACGFAAFANETAARKARDRLPEKIQGLVVRGLNRHPLRDML